MSEMKVIKKFTAIQVGTKNVNDVVKVDLEYGEIRGPYYSKEHPEKEFDSEEEATKYAYKYDPYATWMIVPIIRFEVPLGGFGHQ